MKLFVSVLDAREEEAILGGTGIIEFKKPREGSLEAQPLQMIAETAAVIPPAVESSAAIGEVPTTC